MAGVAAALQLSLPELDRTSNVFHEPFSEDPPLLAGVRAPARDDGALPLHRKDGQDRVLVPLDRLP